MATLGANDCCNETTRINVCNYSSAYVSFFIYKMIFFINFENPFAIRVTSPFDKTRLKRSFVLQSESPWNSKVNTAIKCRKTLRQFNSISWTWLLEQNLYVIEKKILLLVNLIEFFHAIDKSDLWVCKYWHKLAFTRIHNSVPKW